MCLKSSLIFLVFTLTLGKTLAIPDRLDQEGFDLKSLPCVNPDTARNPPVERAISEWFKIGKGDQVRVRYYYNKVDLNGDRDPEVIAHVVGDYVCGSGGCDTLILQRKGKFYRVVSDIPLTYTPIIVSATKTNGWNDLMVKVKGALSATGNISPSYYVTLRFNGREYPSNPTLIQPYVGQIAGTVFLLDSQRSGTGIILRQK